MSSPGNITLLVKKNSKWAPHGPMDYARSARHWTVQPSKYTTFFVRDGKLYRRAAIAVGDASAAAAPSGGEETGQEESEVPAQDVQNDLEYVVPVKIGTPGVSLNLDFDTGSSDFWVWSSSLQASGETGQHTIYDPSKSSTAKLQDGQTWQISYGDGSSASGNVYCDIVAIGNVSIPGQSVEAATQLSQAFLQSNGSDGLLGLAFPSINTVKPTAAKTPVEILIEQKLIAQPLFTVKLDKGDSEGFYTFGYISDQVQTTGDMLYTAVDSSRGFWEFPSASMVVGGQTIQRKGGNTAIADTGTTLLLIDDDAVRSLYATIQGTKMDNQAGGWVIPSNAQVPTIGFAVGDNVFNIAGDDLKFADAGNGMSFGAVQSRGDTPLDIFGDVFLKRVYAIFDQSASPRFGAAQRPLQ